jgi:mannitol/fructose-specific phosphotransferase system IIA component (Ntr-type)
MLEKEVKEREDLGNTGIGRGIGFPHSKSSQVSNILALLARPAKPVEYGSIDNVPVSIILLIVAPADGDNNEYLHTMARISRLLGKSDVREQILKAHSPEEVMQIITKHE